MEIDTPAAAFGDVRIHPVCTLLHLLYIVNFIQLVIASVCDHYTRHSYGGYVVQSEAPVIGLLFGTFDGSIVSICDTTEAVYSYDGVNVIFNSSSIQKKIALWQGVFNQQRLVGWYTLGAEVLPIHYKLHKEV